jgi:hypothetical protein
MNKEVQQILEEFLEAYDFLKRYIKGKDRHQFERWKAGGYIIDPDIMSMYPNLEQVLESLEPDEDEEDEEENS